MTPVLYYSVHLPSASIVLGVSSLPVRLIELFILRVLSPWQSYLDHIAIASSFFTNEKGGFISWVAYVLPFASIVSLLPFLKNRP